MYYKVMYNDRVIDVLDHLVYVKYQPKHNILTLCPEDEAQGFLSSDGDKVWHSEELYKFPVEGYDTVQAVQTTLPTRCLRPVLRCLAVLRLAVILRIPAVCLV